MGGDYDKLEQEIKRLKRCCSCGKEDGGCCYFEVTRAESEQLIADNSLLKGAMYKITDRGDLGVFLDAIETNKFSIEGKRIMLVPAMYNTNTTDIYGNEWQGVWHLDKESRIGFTLAIGDLMIWGGHVWRSVTGDIGTTGSDEALDETNWEIIPKTSFTNNEYIPMVFDIHYDYENDWISKQMDDSKNVFGIDFALTQGTFPIWVNNLNPVDMSDWNFKNHSGLPMNFHYLHNNNCVGVWNNVLFGGGHDGDYGIYDNILLGDLGYIANNWSSHTIHSNICEGGIISNDTYYDDEDGGSINNNIIAGGIESNVVQDIIFNTNAGSIISNTNDGNIRYNNNIGDISSNSNNGSVSYNTNGGLIYNNSNTGNILLNKNNGLIDGNSHQGAIYQNMNNGDILSNSSAVAVDIFSNINNGIITGAQVANVTDAIVNK
jgi:hypothetical protein